MGIERPRKPLKRKPGWSAEELAQVPEKLKAMKEEIGKTRLGRSWKAGDKEAMKVLSTIINRRVSKEKRREIRVELRKENLRKEHLGDIGKLHAGDWKVIQSSINHKSLRRIRHRLRRYVFENHALENMGIDRGELAEEHMEEIGQLELGYFKKMGIEVKERDGELLEELRESFRNNIQENKFFGMIGLKREKILEEHREITDPEKKEKWRKSFKAKINPVKKEDWERKFDEEIPRGEFAEIKKRASTLIWEDY